MQHSVPGCSLRTELEHQSFHASETFTHQSSHVKPDTAAPTDLETPLANMRDPTCHCRPLSHPGAAVRIVKSSSPSSGECVTLSVIIGIPGRASSLIFIQKDRTLPQRECNTGAGCGVWAISCVYSTHRGLSSANHLLERGSAPAKHIDVINMARNL